MLCSAGSKAGKIVGGCLHTDRKHGAFGIWQEVHACGVAEQEATGWLRECGLTALCGGEEREPSWTAHTVSTLLC